MSNQTQTTENNMDTIIALVTAYALRAAKTAEAAAEVAFPITSTTWTVCGRSSATADAYNAELTRVADEACREYYADNPDGNWDEAWTIHTAVIALSVSAPRNCMGRA